MLCAANTSSSRDSWRQSFSQETCSVLLTRPPPETAGDRACVPSSLVHLRKCSQSENSLVNSLRVAWLTSTCLSETGMRLLAGPLTLAHFMWLHRSSFCIGDLQLAQGFELERNHKQLAASP
ncbi:hypothetical protein CgunFtcFv8_013726 [Champsocephalus gunnari]|uniref:Uncharacterized protein n=1 Tax=Champsocephalus gunnari TaxID=52237 RepID=A0AAN8DUP7_CHAGU|nr:hypothetical protein CgunFtcFv8_013726 [Champsocephalus gunnari]